MGINKVTMRDIAAEAGVSPATVFRVLNSDVPVKASTKAKVITAKQYLENKRETDETKQNASFSVGIIMPSFPEADMLSHPSIFAIISSFSKQLAKRGIANSNIIFDTDSDISTAYIAQNKSGYLVIGTSEEQEKRILSAIVDLKTPCFFINRQTNAPYTGSVSMDDESAASEATEYLIRSGHTRIAFVGGNRNYQNTARRLKGYRSAMEKNGLEVPSRYVLFGKYNEASGYETGAEILNMKDRPTAGLFASDSMALGCMRYMKDHKTKVPDDFALIGFGDSEAGRYSEPALSTVSQPDREIGTAAADALIQMMETPGLMKMNIQFKNELVIRETT